MDKEENILFRYKDDNGHVLIRETGTYEVKGEVPASDAFLETVVGYVNCYSTVVEKITVENEELHRELSKLALENHELCGKLHDLEVRCSDGEAEIQDLKGSKPKFIIHKKHMFAAGVAFARGACER